MRTIATILLAMATGTTVFAQNFSLKPFDWFFADGQTWNLKVRDNANPEILLQGSAKVSGDTILEASFFDDGVSTPMDMKKITLQIDGQKDLTYCLLEMGNELFMYDGDSRPLRSIIDFKLPEGASIDAGTVAMADHVEAGDRIERRIRVSGADNQGTTWIYRIGADCFNANMPDDAGSWLCEVTGYSESSGRTTSAEVFDTGTVAPDNELYFEGQRWEYCKYDILDPEVVLSRNSRSITGDTTMESVAAKTMTYSSGVERPVISHKGVTYTYNFETRRWMPEYDFNLEAGDYLEGERVASVEYVEVNGRSRKKIEFAGYRLEYWIECVGSSNMNDHSSLLGELPTCDTERYALEAYYENDKLCFTRADFKKTNQIGTITDGEHDIAGRIFDISGRKVRSPEKGQLFIGSDRRLRIKR